MQNSYKLRPTASKSLLTSFMALAVHQSCKDRVGWTPLFEKSSSQWSLLWISFAAVSGLFLWWYANLGVLGSGPFIFVRHLRVGFQERVLPAPFGVCHTQVIFLLRFPSLCLYTCQRALVTRGPRRHDLSSSQLPTVLPATSATPATYTFVCHKRIRGLKSDPI